MIGTSLGPYKIIEQLGAGGMGEVYLGEDTRLGRKVAIKVLPEEYASDPERLARFEQEARAAAALNHPHIAAVFDVGAETTEGSEVPTHFIVQEYLQGKSLRERLEKGALPLDKALDLAIEVGEALIAAHKVGIIHRDLKPDNIFVTEEGRAKVLDFGLAKLTEMAAPTGTSASMSPTMLGTVAGQIMGTAGYMAPEQVQASGEIDHRADIFGFGCVLYEMISGSRPFSGTNVHETLGRIVDKDPEPLASIDAGLPAEAQRILKKCLAKDPGRRYQAAADLVVDLHILGAEVLAGQAVSLGDISQIGEAALAGTAATGVDATAPGALGSLRSSGGLLGRPISLGSALVAIVVVSLAAGAGVRSYFPSAAATDQPLMVFDVALPEGLAFSYTGRHLVAFSRDGTEIVFTAGEQLQRRRIDEPDVIVPIAGTEGGGRSPFLSPDGTEVGFWFPSQTGGELRKVAVSGGPAAVLCAANNPTGVIWVDDGTILFGQGGGGIMRVSADGGDPEVVIPVNENEMAHGPQLLPDGDSLLFTLRTGSVDWDDAQTMVTSLTDPDDRRALFTGGSDARYLPTGHIVYIRGGTLMARTFDLGRLEVGAAVPLIEGIAGSDSNLTGAGHFTVSDLGGLAYVPESAVSRIGPEPVVWVTATTTDTTNLPGDLETPVAPRLSPNETRVAVMMNDDQGVPQVVVQELSRGIWTRLTTDGDGQFPIWSHDGTTIYFTSTRGTETAIYRRPIDLSSPAEEVWRPGGQGIALADSVSADGKFLFATITGDLLPTAWSVPLDDPAAAAPMFDGVGFQGHVRIHPSGKWIAYAREQQTRRDVVVTEFPAGRTYQISTGGTNEEHVWSRDGTRLFYRSGGRMMVVDVETEPEFRPGPPRELINRFAAPEATLWVAPGKYDVAGDGRFLTTLDWEQNTEYQRPYLRVVLNWFEELKERVPTGGSK